LQFTVQKTLFKMRLFLFCIAWSVLLVSCGPDPDSSSVEKDGKMEVNDRGSDVLEQDAEPASLQGLRAVYESARMVLSAGGVELYRLMIPSRQGVPDHDGGRRIVYALKEAELFVKMGADTMTVQLGAGEVAALPEGMVSLESKKSGGPAQVMILMRSEAPLPACTPAAPGKALPSPTNGRVIYDEGGAFAIHYTLGAGNLAGNLPDVPFLIYGLNDGLLSISEGMNAGKASRSLNGFAKWMDGCSTRLSNAGDTPLEFVVMGFWAE
jgi:hypothetical protein